MLTESTPGVDTDTILELAVEAADAASDATSLLRAGSLWAPQTDPQSVLDHLHLLRHDLARHADRVADLVNGAGAPPPATVTEVARIRSLLERCIGEVVVAPAASALPWATGRSCGEVRADD